MGWSDRTPWAARGARTLPHELDRVEDGRRCRVCGATWSGRPRGHAAHCPGVPLFLGWAAVPSTWSTRTRARREGLAIDDAPGAVVQATSPAGDVTRWPLYAVRQLSLFSPEPL